MVVEFAKTSYLQAIEAAYAGQAKRSKQHFLATLTSFHNFLEANIPVGVDADFSAVKSATAKVRHPSNTAHAERGESNGLTLVVLAVQGEPERRSGSFGAQ